MSYLRKAALSAFVISTVGIGSALSQGPLHKQVNYTINVPYALRKANYLLPPGNYILYQISANDLNLFALYQGDMMHSPIAMIRTTRIIYHAVGYPEETRMLISYNESSPDAHPIIPGWTIPGAHDWEVIGVVPRIPPNVSAARYAVRSKSRFRRTVGYLNSKRWVPHRRG